MPGVTPPRRTRSARLGLAVALLVVAAGNAAGAAGWRQVEALFRDARYDEALRALADLSRGDPGSAEALYWRARLEIEPSPALAAMRAGLARDDLPSPLRARFACEIAGIEYARGRHAAVLEALDRARRLRGAPLQGEAAAWAEASAQALARPRTAARPASARDAPASGLDGRPALAHADDAPVSGAGAAWALQLGAFTEAARANSFLAAWREKVSDLTLVTDRTSDGAPFYKVRCGGWNDREQAVAAARRLRRDTGLEAIVVEAAARP